MSGQEIAQVNPVQELAAKIRGEQFREQVALALPQNIRPERFQRVAITALNQTPELVTVDRGTFFNALLKCAQDGLLPDGREAALVIFNDKDAAGGKRATYLPMIGGLRKIAAKHGIAIEAFVVYAGDDFKWSLGFEPSVHHMPPTLGADRGEPIGAYAVGTDRATGQKWLEVMSKQEIEKVRAVSRAATSSYGPWVKWWEEMARKTVARRLFKQLPFGDLEDADVETLKQADADVELPAVEQPMSEEDANLSAVASAAGAVTDDGGPDDTVDVDPEPEPDVEPEPEPEPVDEPEITVEDAGQASFAQLAEVAQTRRRARSEDD